MFERMLSEAFIVIVLVSGLPLLVSSVVGFVVAVLQTATQIQEQSLSFLVRFSVLSAVFCVLGRKLLEQLTLFLQFAWSEIARMGALCR